MNATLLTRVYREHSVKRRRIKWIKQAREDKSAQYARDKGKMIAALKRARRDGFRVIYIDETVFTRSTVPRTEYCLPEQNMTADKSWVNEPTVAVLSGISREKGQELFIQFPKSVNVEKFKEYLEKLRAANGRAKIALFMDNLSSHTAPASREKMKELGFRCIFNVAYSCDWNPIEYTFARAAQLITSDARKLRNLHKLRELARFRGAHIRRRSLKPFPSPGNHFPVHWTEWDAK